jgi:hypothetical protein
MVSRSARAIFSVRCEIAGNTDAAERCVRYVSRTRKIARCTDDFEIVPKPKRFRRISSRDWMPVGPACREAFSSRRRRCDVAASKIACDTALGLVSGLVFHLSCGALYAFMLRIASFQYARMMRFGADFPGKTYFSPRYTESCRFACRESHEPACRGSRYDNQRARSATTADAGSVADP